MKPRALPLVCAALCGMAAHAQPAVTEQDAPQVDDVFPFIGVAAVPITATGPDALWDLSGIGTGAPQDLPCESPGATAHGSQYPTATLALDAGSVITYMRADETGLYTVGAYKEIGGQSILIHYGNEALFMPYPCTYGTAFTDSSSYSYSFSGGTVDGTGSSAYQADGFGTLVLPYGTIDNVLKVSGTDTVSEGIPGLSYVTVVQQTYFFKPGVHYFLLGATHLSQSVNGGPPQEASGISYLAQEVFAGTGEAPAQGIGVDAWPNPAHDVLHVRYGVGAGRAVQLRLFDAAGKAVRQAQGRTGAAGIQSTALDVEGLPAGIYLLRIADDRGQSGSRQVVVR